MKHSKTVPNVPQKTKACDLPICGELQAYIHRSHATLNDRMLRLPHVKEKIGRAGSTIWKDVKNGTFPPPVRLGARSVAWRESEIQACLDAMTFSSRANQPIDMKTFVALLITSKNIGA